MRPLGDSVFPATAPSALTFPRLDEERKALCQPRSVARSLKRFNVGHDLQPSGPLQNSFQGTDDLFEKSFPPSLPPFLCMLVGPGKRPAIQAASRSVPVRRHITMRQI